MDRLDIVDTQVHLFHTLGIEGCLGAMDALGIQGVLIDEMWSLTPPAREGVPTSVDVAAPIVELPNGVRRPVAPGAQMASMLHPDRFKYELRLDYRDPELEAILRLMADDPHCLAARTDARQPHEHQALAAGDYAKAFRAAADVGLPVSVQTGGMSGLLEPYFKEFTSCRFILDHIGHPKGAAGWEEMLRLGGYPNVHLKWSHAARVFSGAYPFPETQAALKQAIDAYGRERVMWGSDCTMLRPWDSWANTLFYVRETDLISAEDREWVLGRAARTLLGWPAPAA